MSQPLALSVDFGRGFTDAWSAVAEFVPEFIGFLAILLIALQPALGSSAPTRSAS